jgi:hypothetical protein
MQHFRTIELYWCFSRPEGYFALLLQFKMANYGVLSNGTFQKALYTLGRMTSILMPGRMFIACGCVLWSPTEHIKFSFAAPFFGI